MRITNDLFSSHDPIRAVQASFMATIITGLLDEERFESELEGSPISDDALKKLPGYHLFIFGALACGFVCTDLSPDAFPINDRQVNRLLADAPLQDLRAYVHVLQRAEKWADGYGSPVHEAIKSGALRIVRDRLQDDRSLYED